MEGDLKAVIIIVSIIGTFSVAFYRLRMLENLVNMIDMKGSTSSREKLIRIEGEIAHQRSKLQSVEENTTEIKKQLNDMDKKLTVMHAWVEQQDERR